MAFDPNEHLRDLKGQKYLDVKWRLCWLNDNQQNFRIATELLRYIPEREMWVFKAHIDLVDTDGVVIRSAEGTGQETERDFPSGPLEKAETKAIGRALALLGYGTQFALELDEGDRVADAPVAPTKAAPASKAASTAKSETEQVRDRVARLLDEWPEVAAKLPKTAAQMTPDELQKTDVWLADLEHRVEQKGHAADDVTGPMPDQVSVARGLATRVSQATTPQAVAAVVGDVADAVAIDAITEAQRIELKDHASRRLESLRKKEPVRS